MEEENKINAKISKNRGASNKNIEVKEIRLEKMSPGFNLVSLKARHRLNIFKKIFTKSEYKDYIRKGKNMYSISSLMNSKFSISDLYLNEKYNINDIISVYNKIDSKLDSQKIKFTKIKKNKINNLLKNKSLSAINFNKKKSKFENVKLNINEYGHNINKKNMNCASYDAINNHSNINLNDISINQMNKTSYNNKKKNNILNNKSQFHFNNYKKNYSLNNMHKINNISNINSPSTLSTRNKNYINNIKYIYNKFKINNKKEDKLSKSNDFNEIYGIQKSQMPKSCKSSGFIITQFGAIISQYSLLRNKNIDKYIPNYYNLPFIHKNCKIK